MTTLAACLFVAGCFLLMVCGFRINVRVLRRLGARTRKRRPDDLVTSYITGELERIRLKDTIGLEIAGIAVGVLLSAVAIAIFEGVQSPRVPVEPLGRCALPPTPRP